MEYWEYRSLKFVPTGITGGKMDIRGFDKKLNEMGKEGWELVSCFSTTAGNGHSRDVIATFKRRM